MKRFLWIVFIAIFTVGLASAQMDRGSFTGTVTDSSAAVIPGVDVVIESTGTGATYRTQTTATGQYTMPNLPVGTYDLSFESQGFNKLVQRGVELSVSEVRRIDAVMEIGAVTEAIEVTAEVPRLATDVPEVATNLESRNMLEMPLAISGGGRTAEAFAYKLAPGVHGGTWRGFVVGSTAFSKETLLDGATVSLNRAGHFGEMSISMEAMQEFKIQTSGVSAEYGRSQGAVFNYVMKSGTNEVHGSLYGMIRNEAFNANTFANKARGNPRALDRRWDYAASLGAPVYIPKVYNGKNKTFVYIAYERYTESNMALGSPSRTAPVREFYDGDFTGLLGGAIGSEDAVGNPGYKGAIYDPATFRQL
ncbi:MAG: carboxypeptidase regulatory-like domain-containing protein, partial [bacterium]|nr:carboxypeptidase regulatory-like domain-containing protein [bacterium]